TKVLGSDVTEHIRRHHAERRPVLDEVTERTAPVAEHNATFGFLDDIEIALNATLESNKDRRHLFAGQLVDLQSALIAFVDLLADGAAHHADVAGSLLDTDDFLKRS